MKKLARLLISIPLLLLTVSTVLAVENATDSSLTEKIKERLEKTAEEGLEKIKEDVVSKVSTPRQKAFIGSIKAVEAEKIVLEYKAQDYTAVTDENTDIVKASGQKKISLDDLKINDYLITLGFVYPNETELKTKKITLINPPQPPINRQLLSGQIEEIDGNKVKIDAKTFVISSKTNLQVKDVDNPTLENLEIKDYLFAIVVLDKNGDISEVKSVFVLPGKNNPASQTPANATDSASPATDSAY